MTDAYAAMEPAYERRENPQLGPFPVEYEGWAAMEPAYERRENSAATGDQGPGKVI